MLVKYVNEKAQITEYERDVSVRLLSPMFMDRLELIQTGNKLSIHVLAHTVYSSYEYKYFKSLAKRYFLPVLIPQSV